MSDDDPHLSDDDPRQRTGGPRPNDDHPRRDDDDSRRSENGLRRGDGGDAVSQTAGSGGVEHEFGRQGWVLVGVIVVAFLVVPGLLYALPAARDTVAGLGLGWHHTYFALPMIPAVLLGLVAVWSAVRSRSR